MMEMAPKINQDEWHEQSKEIEKYTVEEWNMNLGKADHFVYPSGYSTIEESNNMEQCGLAR